MIHQEYSVPAGDVRTTPNLAAVTKANANASLETISACMDGQQIVQ